MESLKAPTLRLLLVSGISLGLGPVACSTKVSDDVKQTGFWAYVNRPLEPEEGAQGDQSDTTSPSENPNLSTLPSGPIPEPSLPSAYPGAGPSADLVNLPELPDTITIPEAKWVPGMEGFVKSPHTNPPRLVDVSQSSPGSVMLCPFTNKPFLVPGGAINAFENTPMVGLLPAASEQTPPAPVKETPPDSSTYLEKSPVDTLLLSKKKESANVEKKTDKETLPSGVWIPDKPGFVYSPFAARTQVVDVNGLKPGSKVICPFTGKFFLVPTTDPAKKS